MQTTLKTLEALRQKLQARADFHTEKEVWYLNQPGIFGTEAAVERLQAAAYEHAIAMLDVAEAEAFKDFFEGISHTQLLLLKEAA
jgi:hypothetical protein